MAKRPYRLGYFKEIPGRGYRAFSHFSRATYATQEAAVVAATDSLAGRRTWGPDRSGFVYCRVAIYRGGEVVAEVTA